MRTTCSSIALIADTPSFDYGGFVVGESEEDAVLFGKQSVRLQHSQTCVDFVSRRSNAKLNTTAR